MKRLLLIAAALLAVACLCYLLIPCRTQSRKLLPIHADAELLIIYRMPDGDQVVRHSLWRIPYNDQAPATFRETGLGSPHIGYDQRMRFAFQDNSRHGDLIRLALIENNRTYFEKTFDYVGAPMKIVDNEKISIVVRQAQKGGNTDTL